MATHPLILAKLLDLTLPVSEYAAALSHITECSGCAKRLITLRMYIAENQPLPSVATQEQVVQLARDICSNVMRHFKRPFSINEPASGHVIFHLQKHDYCIFACQHKHRGKWQGLFVRIKRGFESPLKKAELLQALRLIKVTLTRLSDNTRFEARFARTGEALISKHTPPGEYTFEFGLS